MGIYLSILLHQSYMSKSHHVLALTEFNEMITKDRATAAKEPMFPELEVPCSSAGMQWLTPTRSYSVTKQSTMGLTARRKSNRKRTWARRHVALGLNRKEKNIRALVLLPLGNSFLSVDKMILNGEAADKEQRKELTGFLQASQEQHMRAKLQSLQASYWAASFVQCLVRRNRVLLIHQLLWNNHDTMGFSYNTLF